MEENNFKLVVFQNTESLPRDTAPLQSIHPITEAASLGDSDSIDKYLRSFPKGYRFCPRDNELLNDYLLNKVANRPLPFNNIRDVDIYKYNPYDLAEKYPLSEDDEQVWYFFTPRERKYPKGERPDRSAGDGFYKATGANKDIRQRVTGEKLGSKQSLVFYRGRKHHSVKTNWIMHEYKIAERNTQLRQGSSDMQLDECTLVRLYENTDKNNAKHETVAVQDSEHAVKTESQPDVGNEHVPSSSNTETVDDEDEKYEWQRYLTNVSIEAGLNQLYQTALHQPDPTWSNMLPDNLQSASSDNAHNPLTDVKVESTLITR